MNDSISIPNGSKYCISGDECLHPSGPVLPLGEFYAHVGSRDGLLSYCKTCMKGMKFNRLPRRTPTNEGEQLAIEKLNSVGIYATTGKAANWQYVDVVAWGCVRIEVKAATLNSHGHYLFTIGHKSGREDSRSDIVILICLGTQNSFHVFPSDHPVFYHTNGKPKKAVTFIPHPKFRRMNSFILDQEIMTRASDDWGAIERARIQIGQQLMKQGDT